MGVLNFNYERPQNDILVVYKNLLQCVWKTNKHQNREGEEISLQLPKIVFGYQFLNASVILWAKPCECDKFDIRPSSPKN